MGTWEVLGGHEVTIALSGWQDSIDIVGKIMEGCRCSRWSRCRIGGTSRCGSGSMWINDENEERLISEIIFHRCVKDGSIKV